MAQPSESIFCFDRFSVRSDRMVCDLRVTDARFAALDEPAIVRSGLAALLEQRFPALRAHACVNDYGPVFGACMAHASMPHLLEHLVIALQAEAEAAQVQAGILQTARPFLFVGKTSWTDRAALAARVEVNYRDDITAFRAFRDAARLVDSIVLE